MSAAADQYDAIYGDVFDTEGQVEQLSRLADGGRIPRIRGPRGVRTSGCRSSCIPEGGAASCRRPGRDAPAEASVLRRQVLLLGLTGLLL